MHVRYFKHTFRNTIFNPCRIMSVKCFKPTQSVLLHITYLKRGFAPSFWVLCRVTKYLPPKGPPGGKLYKITPKHRNPSSSAKLNNSDK